MMRIELNECNACKRIREDTQIAPRHVENQVLTLCVDPVDCRKHWPEV